MHHRINAVLALAVLALAACGDDAPSATTTGGPSGGGDDPPAAGRALDAEVVLLAEGVPPLDGAPAVQVLDPGDPEAAAALFVEAEREAVVEAVAGADLDGRTLLGGLVHEGCSTAGGVAVVARDDTVTFRAEDVDPQEGEVVCARAVVTAAVVAVATEDLPDGVTGPAEPTATTEPDVEVDGPEAGSGLLAEVLLIEPTGAEAADVVRPGLVRDRVDVEALFGRYGLGEPDPVVLARVETGEDVLVAGVVGDECTPPTDAYVSRVGDELELSAGYGPDQLDDDTVCEALAPALVVVAVSADDVAGARTVDGHPAEGPAGVGVIHAVEPVDVGVEPLAVAAADEGGVDAVLAGIPGAPSAAELDLPPAEAGVVRLVFVVEACEPGTAELIADEGSGTVRAEAQQTGDRVECDALDPHVVVADLAPDHADLEPTAA